MPLALFCLVEGCLAAGLLREGHPVQKDSGEPRNETVPKLQMFDDAATDADLRVPPSNHLEKLKGTLVGWHSIRVNEQWRLVFRCNGSSGEASEVYLDNHNYR